MFENCLMLSIFFSVFFNSSHEMQVEAEELKIMSWVSFSISIFGASKSFLCQKKLWNLNRISKLVIIELVIKVDILKGTTPFKIIKICSREIMDF